MGVVVTKSVELATLVRSSERIQTKKCMPSAAPAATVSPACSLHGTVVPRVRSRSAKGASIAALKSTRKNAVESAGASLMRMRIAALERATTAAPRLGSASARSRAVASAVRPGGCLSPGEGKVDSALPCP